MTENTNAVEIAAELTAAWLSNPNTRTSADDVPSFLLSMHAAVIGLSGAADEPPEAVAVPSYKPAVSVRKSLSSPDHIVSMIDGKSYRTLRRHLATNGLTPEEYRQRYDLKADYPMVAPAYSESRRAMAKSIGLDRKTALTVETKVENAGKTIRRSGKAALDAAKKALGVEF